MLDVALALVALAGTAGGGAEEGNLMAGDQAMRKLLPAAGPTMAIWPDKPPDEPREIGEEKATGGGKKSIMRIEKVSRPTITLCPPKDVKPNAAAVLVCPGGGYGILAAEHEGTEIVQWLNSFGVTGVLLKYRVPRREQGFEKHHQALQDAQRAMGLIRLHAKEWKLDPNRVGIMGFSAGGHLSASACNNYDKRIYGPVDKADKLSCRPDFAILIYPAYLAEAKALDQLDGLQHAEAMSKKTTPPTFIAVSQLDPYAASGIGYFVALMKAKVPAALHVYPEGSHGTGLRAYPLNQWGREAQRWMADIGVIAKEEGTGKAEGSK